LSGMRNRPGMTMAALAMLLPVGAGAAEGTALKPKAAVAADFLEYLAVLEGEEDNWTDFEAVTEKAPPKNPKAAAPKAAKAVEPK
jgi:hypothetical protein